MTASFLVLRGRERLLAAIRIFDAMSATSPTALSTNICRHFITEIAMPNRHLNCFPAQARSGQARRSAVSAWAGPLLALAAILLQPMNASRAQAEDIGILAPGDAAITSFSGVVDPLTDVPEGSPDTVLDETLINVTGTTLRIDALAAPGYVWDARMWQNPPVWEFKALDIGQVFGVTIDDAKFPNIYTTATSAYGLHIVAPDADGDGRPERLKKGAAAAQWMPGMWGTTDEKDPPGSVGGPGSIWKIDGKTAEVSLFANVMLKGNPNSGAGLGNITYVPEFKQLFVSDLSTGMIHRFNMDGTEAEIYDHGDTGRTAAKLPPIAYDPAGTLDITSKDFDSEDPESWGFTDPDRRVWALAFHDGRLFYSVVGGSQIWSVGFDKKTGKFLNDAQWELDVPKKPKNLPVTDMVFSHKGAMILAQRGEMSSAYDYANFADTGKARTYRYWLENPDDPKTPSRWIAEPEEYAVGFDDNNRATDGGLALNYGYNDQGYIDSNQCEASLWTTGDNLRHTEDAELQKALLKGGPLAVDGLQGMPAGPVKNKNTPPWASYMLDVEAANTDLTFETDDPIQWSDNNTQGWMGDVAIYHPCGSGFGGGGNSFGGAGYGWSDPDYVTGGGGGSGTGGQCTPGVDCPPPPPKACIKTAGEMVCDESTGQWSYALQTAPAAGFNPDMIKITGGSPGVSVVNGPMIPLSSTGIAGLDLAGAAPGQLITIPICLFNQAEMDSGKPFDCCKTTITVRVPTKACVKK